MLGKNIYCRRAHIFLIIYHSCFKGMQILFKCIHIFWNIFVSYALNWIYRRSIICTFIWFVTLYKTSAAICSHILQSFTFIVYFKQSSQFDVCFATYTPRVTLYSCVGLLLLPEKFCRLSPKDKKNCLI